MYAVQNVATASMASQKKPIAGSDMRSAKSTPERRNPKCALYAVRSPTAVPRAKVTVTVSQ
jgi:hypothetical protein